MDTGCIQGWHQCIKHRGGQGKGGNACEVPLACPDMSVEGGEHCTQFFREWTQEYRLLLREFMCCVKHVRVQGFPPCVCICICGDGSHRAGVAHTASNGVTFPQELIGLHMWSEALGNIGKDSSRCGY